MTRPTDVRPVAAALYFLPVQTRVPLKFGPETLTSVTCARVRLRVEDRQAGQPRAGARRRSACSGCGRAACPTRRGEQRPARFLRALAERLGRLSRLRASAGGGPRLPGARSCPACWSAFNRERGGRADALAGGAGLLFGLRHRPARCLRRAARAARLRDLRARVHEPRPGRLSGARPRAQRDLFRGRYADDYLVLPAARRRCRPGTWWAGWTRWTPPS